MGSADGRAGADLTGLDRYLLQRLLPLLPPLLLVPLILAPAALHAQIVRGEVRDAASGAPLEGVFVTVEAPDGARVGGALTDRHGLFRLRPRAPGTYRLRIERIGFESILGEPVEVEADGEIELAFRMSPRAIALRGITAFAEQRCVMRPEEGLAVHALWDEARKALEISSFIDSGELHRFRVELYVRELDRDAARIVRHRDFRIHEGFGSRFEGIPPAELATHGFAREEGSAWILFGPDADALLSDEFLDTHCFRVVERDQEELEGLVGLGFEPVRERDVPEVRGVMWLERATSRLRHLEYEYVNVPLPEHHLGGRVEFDVLDGGAWFVRRWWIRSPISTVRVRRGIRGRPRIEGVREEGGQVTAVLQPATPVVEERLAVSGVVFDSIRGAPLAGALVFLNGTQYADTTDAEGRFEIAGIPRGRYGLTFSHPRLAAVCFVPPIREIGAEAVRVEGVVLAIPAAAAVAEGEGEDAVAPGGGCRADQPPSAAPAAVRGSSSRESEGSDGSTRARCSSTWGKTSRAAFFPMRQSRSP